MSMLTDDLRILCSSCIMAPRNRNQERLRPACGQCIIKHQAADEIERLERALRDVAAVVVPPAEAECDYEHQRVIYRLRSIAVKALGEEELP